MPYEQALPPFLQGLLAAQQQGNQEQQLGLQSAQTAVGLQGALQKQQQEAAFRRAIAGAPEDQWGAIAARAAGPEGVLKHLDTQEKNRTSKELAIQRMKMSDLQHQERIDVARRNAATAEQRAVVEAYDKAYKQHRDSALLQLGIKKQEYDIGPTGVSLPNTTLSMDPAAPQAEAIPGIAPELLAGRSPAEIAAIRSVAAAGNTPARADVGNYQPPQAAPSPMPQSAPAAPQLAPVASGGAMDMMGSAGTGLPGAAPVAPTPIPSAAVTAPTGPQMPNFTGSPRQINEAKNKWLAAQAKAGEAGGKASESVVDAIVAGRMPVPTGFALRSPYWQDVIERVANKDPNFDASRYVARSAARRTFSSGPEARNVTALNTVIGHLGTLDEAATALQNQDLRAFNMVANRLATEMGDPRIVSFDTARQAVAEETMRVFRQVGASEQEARRWGDLISSSGSPAQLKGNIKTLGDLLDSRVEAIAQQYERTVRQDGNPARVDPKNVETLNRLRGGGSVRTFGTQEEAAAADLPDGTRVIINGVSGTWKK